MRPSLRRFAFQLMYFWITFWTSCGLSVLGIPELRAITRYFAMVGLLFVSKTNGGVENRQVETVASRPPHPALSPRGEGVDSLGELGPDHHARARAPREGRHVGEHIGRSPGESHGQHPCDQLRRAARASLLHTLERAFAQERLVIALLEEIQEPEIELLVHPEVARSTRFVGEAARTGWT